ncbi:MAG: PilZ domain-containing protein [Candidatus Omnitrophota bacterium]|nr:PilZ domain-containing protein [Candidatus Omnitrophota bacterium]
MVFLREEKRQFVRINLKTPFYYQVRGSCDFNNTITENISIGGVGIINNKFINPEALLNLEMKILSRVLNVKGKVSWLTSLAHSSTFRMGIEFIELDNLDKLYLSDYISMQTKSI